MMKDHDTIQRFLFEDNPIRGTIVRLNKSFSTIVSQYDYPDPVKQLLGETLLAVVMLSNMIKYKGQVTIQLQSQGPITLLVAKCDHQFQVRGLAKWNEKINRDLLAATLGEGELVITLLRDDVVKPYQSIVPLKGQHVPEALAYYFAQSEQLPSRFFMSVQANEAVGLMLQVMPEQKSQMDESHWDHISQSLDSFEMGDWWSKENKSLLKDYFKEHDLRVFDSHSVEFHCQCDLNRMQNAVKTLGEEEAMQMLKKKQAIVVTCEYCRNEHAFSQDEIQEIFND